MKFKIDTKGATEENFDADDFIHDMTELLGDTYMDLEIKIEKMNKFPEEK